MAKVKDKALIPLPRWAVLLFPLLIWLIPRSERDRFKKRRDLTVRLASDRRMRLLENEKLQREANDYWQIISSCFVRMGNAHIPTNQARNLMGGKLGKIQAPKCEKCFITPEIIYYKILTRRPTLFGSKQALPFMVYVGDLIRDETLQELSWACHRRVGSVHQDPRFGVWLLVYRMEGVGGLLLKVDFKNIIENYPLDMSTGTLVLGIGEHRTVHSRTLASHPHVLIAGSSGSGKSNMVNQMISALMMFTDPTDLKFILIDLKKMEYKLFRKASHLYCPVVTEAAGALSIMQELVGEIERRARLMEDTEVKEIATWNERYSDQALPRLICVIDEFAELRLAQDEKIAKESINLVKRISNLGRAVGVHLWICTQRPATNVLGNDVKINMPLIIGGRTQSRPQSVVILDNGHLADLDLVPGRMIYQSGSEEYEIQTPYIDENDIRRAVAISRGRGEKLITMEGIEPLILQDNLTAYMGNNHLPLTAATADNVLSDYGIDRAMFRSYCKDMLRRIGQDQYIGGNLYRIAQVDNGYSVILVARDIEAPAASFPPNLSIVQPVADDQKRRGAATLLSWRAMKERRKDG